jgi:cation transport ATPase
MTGLHSAVGVALLGALAVLGLAAGIASLRHATARWADRARQIALAVVVAEGAVGLALAFRGAGPAEWLHWLYGGILVLVLLAPAALEERIAADRRTPVLALAAVAATVLAWRLGASG